MNDCQQQLRCQFVTRTLAASVLRDPTPFYEAFEEGEDALTAFLTGLWESLVKREGQSLSQCPFFPDVVPYVLEDTEDGFCALVCVTLPETATAPETAAVVVFGSAMDPRVFAMTPVSLRKGDSAKVSECRDGSERDVAVLYQGCDNDLQLFDPPTPQKCDKDAPLAKSRRHAAMIDKIVCWCMEND